MKKYDVAAYVWPAYTGNELRTRMFWEEGYGEWQTVKKMTPRFEGHLWPRKPLWGYVNEADPYVMEMQIEAATRHGVNIFIYDWYWYDNRPFLENCLNDGFLKARNNDKMKFYLMWANHDANTVWDKRLAEQKIKIWGGGVDRHTFDYIVDRTIDKYFTHPSYYKIDGKPVYMIFHPVLFTRGLGGAENAKRAIDHFAERTVRAGFAGLELQVCVNTSIEKMADENTTILNFVKQSNFGSASFYQYREFCNMNASYPDILEEAKQMHKKYADKLGIPLYPHVSVGWDVSPRYNTLNDQICRDNTPENVQKAFEFAKNYVDTHPELRAPLITVNSWNEWTETSYLQPDDLYGYGYLEALKKVFVDQK